MPVRATNLCNFRGDPYITRPDLEEIIGGDISNMMAIKPFTFTAADMTSSNGNLSIVIPGIVFNVFRNDTGIAYGEIEYLTGDDSGKTRFSIEDYVGEEIVTEGTPTAFTAMAFVLANGSPIAILPAGSLSSNP